MIFRVESDAEMKRALSYIQSGDTIEIKKGVVIQGLELPPGLRGIIIKGNEW